MTVEALLLFNGTDGATTFTDGTSNQTWTVNDSGSGTVCELDTAEQVHGTASLKVGADDSIQATLNTALSGEYTIEGWFYVDSASNSGDVVLLDADMANPYYYQIRYNCTNDNIQWYSPYGQLTISQGVDRPDHFKQDNWIHIAVARDANGVVSGCVMGLYASTLPRGASGAHTTPDITDINIGDHPTTVRTATGFVGWVDSVRISDEFIYQSGQVFSTLPEPGLTYTVTESGLWMPDHSPIAVQHQLHPGMDIQNLRDNVKFENTDQDCPGTAGVQIWG